MIDFLVSEGFVCQDNPSDAVTEWKAPHLAEHGFTVTAVVGGYLFKVDVHCGEKLILEVGRRRKGPVQFYSNATHDDLSRLPAIIAAYTYAAALASRLEAYLAAQTKEHTPC